MGVTKQIAYFNAIFLRTEPSPGLGYEWHIEESRIKGGFNNTFMDFGVRAYAVDETYANERRKNAIIYSGLFNSKTGVNNLNQFPIGSSITKAVDISNGGIQKLFAEDERLIILQEDKVSFAPVDKDFIFTAEGAPLASTSNLFIGAIVPYLGRYGIGTVPESFAHKGGRKYFADNKRNVVLRLSRDGLTEISYYGMHDWFKDNLKIANHVYGMYDSVKDQYIIHLDTSSIDYTLGFDESSNGWTSFYKYYPEGGFSLGSDFYTLKTTLNEGPNIWKHYQTTNYNSFYGTQENSYVQLIMNNETSLVKTFHTVNYEGTSGWSVQDIKTDLDNINDYTDQAFDIDKYNNTYFKNLDTNNLIGGNIFNKKENKYFSIIKNNSSINENEVLFGQEISGIKGMYASLTFKTDTNATSKQELFAVSSEVAQSSN